MQTGNQTSQNKTTEEILLERGRTHGDFSVNARISQSLKAVVKANLADIEAYNEGRRKLTEVQSESIDMILHKISRICAGNPNERDHWDDIAGYAKLAADRCQK